MVWRTVAFSSDVLEIDHKMSCSRPKGVYVQDFLILWLFYFTDKIHHSAYLTVFLWFRFCLTLTLN